MDPKLIFMSKAKPFTGANGQEWRRWLTRFEAQTVTWSAAERLQCLPALLEDGALDLYASLTAAAQADYVQVVEALSERYGSEVGPLQAQAELARAMQTPGETVADFADRIRKLGRAAYPEEGMGDAPVEFHLTSRFLCGLRNEQLQSKLCSKNVKTLAAAITAARELQTRHEAMLAVRQSAAAAAPASNSQEAAVAGPVTARPGGREAMSNAGDSPTAGRGCDETEVDRVRALERRMVDMQQMLLELSTSGHHSGQLGDRQSGQLSHGPFDQSAVALMTAATPANLRCYNCGQVGHTRRTCTVQGTAGRGRQSTENGGRCFGCGEAGHMVRNCPRSAQQSAIPQRLPFCLGCGKDGHWLADCRMLSVPMDQRQTRTGHVQNSRHEPQNTGQGN